VIKNRATTPAARSALRRRPPQTNRECQQKETNVTSIELSESAVAPDRSGSLGRFALKTAIVAAAVTIALWIIIGQVFDRLDDMIDRGGMQLQAAIRTTSRIGGKSFWGRLEHELDRAAAPGNDLTPEKKQKLLADIHILAERYRPFVSEATLLFADKPTAPINTPK
jgi:hypothetical protein